MLFTTPINFDMQNNGERPRKRSTDSDYRRPFSHRSANYNIKHLVISHPRALSKSPSRGRSTTPRKSYYMATATRTSFSSLSPSLSPPAIQSFFNDRYTSSFSEHELPHKPSSFPKDSAPFHVYFDELHTRSRTPSSPSLRGRNPTFYNFPIHQRQQSPYRNIQQNQRRHGHSQPRPGHDLENHLNQYDSPHYRSPMKYLPFPIASPRSCRDVPGSGVEYLIKRLEAVAELMQSAEDSEAEGDTECSERDTEAEKQMNRRDGKKKPFQERMAQLFNLKSSC
ncbi:hypothetical protein BDQ12DRAFT_731818 [Crucibulum laeve]|uniref:Uncharacterized protein n=1 Tax=Crucibulum laeve TaxID=68775 RepID=A0A5C3MRD3_9AGAR|nr:hypothetical protein BDQ12DRAFT_731818 [Crucibulum laeve]